MEDVSYLCCTAQAYHSDEVTAPPQLSAAELKAQEQEATLTVQKIIVGAVLLYLCTSSASASLENLKEITNQMIDSTVCDRCREEACLESRKNMYARTYDAVQKTEPTCVLYEHTGDNGQDKVHTSIHGVGVDGQEAVRYR